MAQGIYAPPNMEDPRLKALMQMLQMSDSSFGRSGRGQTGPVDSGQGGGGGSGRGDAGVRPLLTQLRPEDQMPMMPQRSKPPGSGVSREEFDSRYDPSKIPSREESLRRHQEFDTSQGRPPMSDTFGDQDAFQKALKEYQLTNPPPAEAYPRDARSGTALEMLKQGQYDRLGPGSFTPSYEPGGATPRGQRRARSFEAYVGDKPATDSEIEEVYGDVDAGMGPSTQSEINAPGAVGVTTEEELNDIHAQMDKDAGQGDISGAQSDLETALEDADANSQDHDEAQTIKQGLIEEFIAKYGEEALPPSAREALD